jgi:hypothetical protein
VPGVQEGAAPHDTVVQNKKEVCRLLELFWRLQGHSAAAAKGRNQDHGQGVPRMWLAHHWSGFCKAGKAVEDLRQHAVPGQKEMMFYSMLR